MRAVNRFMLAALSGIMAITATAADNGEGGMQWYFSAGIPVTNLESSSFVSDAAALGVTVTDEVGDVTVGGQSTLGVMVTSMFGAEIRYSASGNSRDNPTITNITAPPLRGDAKLSIDGITLYGVARWPVHEQVDLLGKLGYTFQDLDLDANLAGTIIDTSDDDENFAAAIGVRLRTAENWAVTAEVEYLAVDFSGALDEPIRGSINLEYLF